MEAYLAHEAIRSNLKIEIGHSSLFLCGQIGTSAYRLILDDVKYLLEGDRICAELEEFLESLLLRRFIMEKREKPNFELDNGIVLFFEDGISAAIPNEIVVNSDDYGLPELKETMDYHGLEVVFFENDFEQLDESSELIVRGIEIKDHYEAAT